MKPPRPSAGREAGFSLIELLIALVVAIEILIAAAIAFDVHNRMAVVQSQVTDLQQSLRIAQYDVARLVRMAGRGGLPASLRPDLTWTSGNPVLNGQALEIRNDVPASGDLSTIARGVNTSPKILPGTDVITVRGCFANSVYQLQPAAFLPVDSDGDQLSDGDVTFSLDSRSVANIRQPLGPLVEQLNVAGTTPLLIFMSPIDRATYGVGRVTDHAPASGDPDTMQITVNVDPGSLLNPEIVRTAPLTPARGMPANMTAALVCLLEEYRYYIREEHEIPGDNSSPLRPRLTRARFEPGTELPYANDTQNYSLDLADGVFDLQVALGFDSDYPSTSSTTPGSFDDDLDYDGVDDTIFEAAAGSNARNTDDWLYNDPTDDPTDIQYREHGFTTRVGQPVHLYFVRVTTIARTNRPDPDYRAPDFDATAGTDLVEDHDYDRAPANQFKSDENRKYRRRMLTTVVDMRNI